MRGDASMGRLLFFPQFLLSYKELVEDEEERHVFSIKFYAERDSLF